MNYINFFDFDLLSDDFSFINWASILTASRSNPDSKPILWLTKEIKTNYYILDIISRFEIKNWHEYFSHNLSSEKDKFFAKAFTLSKFPGASLCLNDIYLESIHIQEKGLFFFATNPYEFPVKIDRSFFWSNEFNNWENLIRQINHENEGFIQSELFDLGLNIFKYDNTEFYRYHLDEKSLVDLFIDKSSATITNSFSLNHSKFQPILKKINERNIYFLHNLLASTITNFIASDLERINLLRNEFLAINSSSNLLVNLGSGSKFMANMVNVDLYEESGADLICDLSKPNWPLKDSTVKFALCHSVLEHIDGDISIFFIELYRVMCHEGVVEFVLPHPRHDWFYQDPTHVRPMLPVSFEHFDRSKSIQWYLSGSIHTPLALYWGIDFKIISLQERIVDSNLTAKLNTMNIENKQFASYFLNNIIGDFKITLQAIKQ